MEPQWSSPAERSSGPWCTVLLIYYMTDLPYVVYECVQVPRFIPCRRSNCVLSSTPLLSILVPSTGHDLRLISMGHPVHALQPWDKQWWIRMMHGRSRNIRSNPHWSLTILGAASSDGSGAVHPLTITSSRMKLSADPPQPPFYEAGRTWYHPCWDPPCDNQNSLECYSTPGEGERLSVSIQ